MTHPNARHAEIEREGRRRQVAALLLGGLTDHSRIAEQLGVSRVTIGRDIKIIEADWRVRAAEDIDAAKGKDLQRTERLIQSLWPEALKGRWLATDRIIALMQHRARLLGLDAPQKREDTHTVNLRIMAGQIAAETGLNEDEVMAEAQRIITAGSAS